MRDTTEDWTPPLPVEVGLPARLTGLNLPSSEAETACPDDGEPLAPLQSGERYSLSGEVGRGGMGTILQARDNDLLRDVAMKVLRRPSATALRRFVLEAQIAGQLDHPSVLPVYDMGLDVDGKPYFTMKLVRSHETLNDVIEKLREEDPVYQERYTFQRRVQLIQRVCQALDYAHQRGVIHRDIKPANIIVGPYGEVYLVDWGIAKLAGSLPDPAEGSDPRPVEGGDADLHQTDPDSLVGTPAYMAPEQIRDREAVDPISDVYSLTAVLYELLSLHYYLGHVDGDVNVILMAVLAKLPPEAESYRSSGNGRVPRVLSRICERGLAKERADRFQSARELEVALQKWFEGTAPVVCGGTGMQRVLARWSDLVDLHPFLVPVVTTVLAVLFVRWLILSSWGLVQLLLYG